MFPLCNNRFIYCISVSIISIELPSNSVVRIYFGIRLNPLCVCITQWAGLPFSIRKNFEKMFDQKYYASTQTQIFGHSKMANESDTIFNFCTKKIFSMIFAWKKPNFFIVLAHSASLLLMMVFGKRITTYTLPQVELMHVKTFDLFLRNKNC